ncbi:rhodanese-like domain containing protein [Nitzschia inconspicua]|uniref:Rhodanese-like domain containing protein n=1 Tax=Nitzschia inconspicua TaxID=303405 RepID=A0A9K3PET5_9STRA|nr:rhodanese-like domain containing protein [Nitzschia inconspicua]KAG7370463.1 rhodanese-like domain containing protein [Nitzschia inconspicua]
MRTSSRTIFVSTTALLLRSTITTPANAFALTTPPVIPASSSTSSIRRTTTTTPQQYHNNRINNLRALRPLSSSSSPFHPFSTFTKSLFNMMMMSSSPDYSSRKAEYQLADKEVLMEQLKNSETIVLDVRTEAEIAADGKFSPSHLQYRHVPCTPTDASNLTMQAATLIPSQTTPIIVYCKSGRRASTAQKALNELGYNHVFNAGGFGDIQDMKL